MMTASTLLGLTFFDGTFPRRGVRTPLIVAAAPVSSFSFERLTPKRDTLPILLFLPGIDGSGRAGLTQWPRLSSTFEVHALKMTPDDQTTFEGLIEGCRAFLSETSAHRGSLLVGESTGAVLALGVALKTSHVDGLCLVNPATSYSGSPLSAIAPLLPRLPRSFYRAAPLVITPLFGKPDWIRTIIDSPAPPLVPRPADLLAASEALADVLTPEALAWRLEAHLEEGSRKVNAWLTASPLWSSTVPAVATLLVAGGRDLILPSVAETLRLQQRIPGSVRKVLPQAGHACLDDGRNLNLRLELALSGVLSKVEAAHKARQRAASEAVARLAADKVAAAAAGSVQSWYDQGLRLNGKMAATPREGLSDAAESEQQLEQQPDLDPAPNSLFETWLQSMRRLFSPLFFTVVGDTGLRGGRLEAGVQGLKLPTDGRPVLFVGNHQLYGFDGPLLVEELLRERGRRLRPMVFPPLLAKESPLAPFPYPLPGTAETFERFGATPVSARSLLGALQRGESVLLFPGGAREVFKRKGEEYSLFWGDEPDIVRLAARVNATIVPFSGLGGDESFTMALDSEELLAMPAVGNFFKQRIEALPSLVPGDVFVPPFGYISPARHYFLFGLPIDLRGVDPNDRETCARLYAEVRGAVDAGITRLQLEVRANDPYRKLVPRTAWEAMFDAQAPGPAL